jgi:signal peptidase I
VSSTETSSPSHPTRSLAKLARGASGVVLVLVIVAVVGGMLVPALLGYNLYAIDGGSMEPTIHRGALAYAEEVHADELKVGDIITYVPPGHSRAVTHRIVEVTRPDPRGRPVYRTKGDANARPDMRLFRLDRPTQARYSFSVPVIGWALIFLGIPVVKVLALGLPALLVAVWMMASLWREGGRRLREQDEAASEYGALDAEDEELAAGAGAGARA